MRSRWSNQNPRADVSSLAGGQSPNVASIVSRRARLTGWAEDLLKPAMVHRINRGAHFFHDLSAWERVGR